MVLLTKCMILLKCRHILDVRLKWFRIVSIDIVLPTSGLYIINI